WLCSIAFHLAAGGLPDGVRERSSITSKASWRRKSFPPKAVSSAASTVKLPPSWGSDATVSATLTSLPHPTMGIPSYTAPHRERKWSTAFSTRWTGSTRRTRQRSLSKRRSLMTAPENGRLHPKGSSLAAPGLTAEEQRYLAQYEQKLQLVR